MPSHTQGAPAAPRVAVSVVRYFADESQLCVGFNYECGGHAEILSLAEAESLAEKLCEWIELIRFEQFYGKQQPQEYPAASGTAREAPGGSVSADPVRTSDGAAPSEGAAA